MTHQIAMIQPGMPLPALVEAIRAKAPGIEDKEIRVSPAGGIHPNHCVLVEVVAEEKKSAQLTRMEDMVGKTVKEASLNRYPDVGWGGGTLLEIQFTDGSTINFSVTGGIGGASVEVTEVQRAA